MANLTEIANWETGIYQIETTDLVLGGPAGVANLQPKQLANRTSWLKQQVESLGTANVDWSRIINKPTTLAGYGITDAVPASRTITANSPLTGGGDLSANRAIGIQDGTTAQKGAVQLYGGVDSASNTLAATAGALKTAYDLANTANAAANAALPKAGGTMTGIISFAAGQTIDRADGLTGVTDLRVGSVAVGARYGSGVYAIYGATFDSGNPFIMYEIVEALQWDAPAGTWKSLGLIDVAPYGKGQVAVRIA
jgi:hypothetical protein